MPPCVSVIIPAYNAARYVTVAIESALRQKFTDREIIVINDGSPDASELEEAIGPYKGRITYLAQPNGGPSAARNLGICHARGEFVAFLDSDDAWLPELLSTLVPMLRQDRTLCAVYPDALITDASGTHMGTFMQSTATKGPVTLESLLRWRCSIITSGVVARRSAIVEAGLFDIEFRRSEDFDLWCRMLHRGGRIEYTRECLLVRNNHGYGLSADYVLMLEGQRAVYQKLRQQLTLPAKLRRLLDDRIRTCDAALCTERGRAALAKGAAEDARRAFSEARKLKPTPKLVALGVALSVAPRMSMSLLRLRECALLGRR